MNQEVNEVDILPETEEEFVDMITASPKQHKNNHPIPNKSPLADN